MHYSQTLRHAQLAQIEATIGASPHLKIFDGTPPGGTSGSDTGSVLVDMTLPSDWLAAPSGGSVVKSGTWEVVASLSGTATYWRIFTGSTCHMQGDMTELVLTSNDIVESETVTISSFQITAGNS